MTNEIGKSIKITLDAMGDDKFGFIHTFGEDSLESLQDIVRDFYSESYVWIIPNMIIRMIEIADRGGKSEIAVPIDGFEVADIIWIESV